LPQDLSYNECVSHINLVNITGIIGRLEICNISA
jgi:hypothetical protein